MQQPHPESLIMRLDDWCPKAERGLCSGSTIGSCKVKIVQAPGKRRRFPSSLRGESRWQTFPRGEGRSRPTYQTRKGEGEGKDHSGNREQYSLCLVREAGRIGSRCGSRQRWSNEGKASPATCAQSPLSECRLRGTGRCR